MKESCFQAICTTFQREFMLAIRSVNATAVRAGIVLGCDSYTPSNSWYKP